MNSLICCSHSSSFPSGMSLLPCLRAVDLHIHHGIYFMLSHCRFPLLAHRLDSITWRTQSRSPPFFLALSEEKTPASHSSGLPVLSPLFLFPQTSHRASFLLLCSFTPKYRHVVLIRSSWKAYVRLQGLWTHIKGASSPWQKELETGSLIFARRHMLKRRAALFTDSHALSGEIYPTNIK